MKEIVGVCLSQLHDDKNAFELLIASSDGREVGHVVSRKVAQEIAAHFANEFDQTKDDNSDFRVAVGMLLGTIRRHGKWMKSSLAKDESIELDNAVNAVRMAWDASK